MFGCSLHMQCTSLASQTQPTPARIAFSITHGILKAIRAGVGWVRLARLTVHKVSRHGDRHWFFTNTRETIIGELLFGHSGQCQAMSPITGNCKSREWGMGNRNGKQEWEFAKKKKNCSGRDNSEFLIIFFTNRTRDG